MLDTAVKGSKKYWTWIAILVGIIFVAFLFYLKQLSVGLGITGMSRDVSWGFYIAQFTFLVGVAAGGVMLVLPYYLHNYKVFGKITILGEFLAISALVMCLLFIMVDLGQPGRALNVMLHPTPYSMLFILGITGKSLPASSFIASITSSRNLALFLRLPPYSSLRLFHARDRN